MTQDVTELAVRAAINLLRNSTETGRMPSGLELAPESIEVHEAAVEEFERLLASVKSESPTLIEESPMPDPHPATESPDARIIDICEQMLAINEQQEALVDLDPYAPDRGPYHEEYEALEEEFEAFKDALFDAPRPTTTEGLRAFARVGMIHVFRTSEYVLRPEGFSDWLRLVVVTSVAGMGETVPLPDGYPRSPN